MRILVMIFGYALDIGLDRVGADAQVITVTGAELERADQDETEHGFGFGKGANHART